MTSPAPLDVPATRYDALTGKLAADLERASDLESALDALHEVLGGLGYSALAWGMTTMPRLADGTLASPIVRTRAFPSRWDRHWSHLCDPYYRSCFTTTLPLKWV